MIEHDNPFTHQARLARIAELVPEGSRVLATGAAFTLDGDVIRPVEEGAEAAPAAAQGG